MPLFGSGENTNAAVAERQRSTTPPHSRSGFFARRSHSAERAEPTRDTRRSPTSPSTHSSGLFGRRRSVDRDSSDIGRSPTTTSSSSFGGLFGLRHSSSDDSILGRDPSIMSAKKKVQDAEAAEAEADRALHAARMAVREARNHVKILEAEAKEEYVLFVDLYIL